MRQGRFEEPASETAQLYSESVSIDWRLYSHDIRGSLAHAAALAAAGILTKEEHEQIGAALAVIEAEIKAGDFRWERSLEDVHMNIEAVLTKRIGTAGAKLHTARSRNDQVALDLRLYVKAEAVEVCTRLRSLQRALLSLAERHQGVVLPGYTHLQRAQPIRPARRRSSARRGGDRGLDDCARS
jgi:argininosuccinate lyase